MSAKYPPRSHRDKSTVTPLSSLKESNELSAPRLHHSRSQSQLTTNSEVWRQELAIVPAPLNLTPKVFQASHFVQHSPRVPTGKLKRPLNPRSMALHRAKRFSRLRELAIEQRADFEVNDEDLEYVYEDQNDDVLLEATSDMENDDNNSVDSDSYSLVGSSALPQVEPATRYDHGRNSGLPSSPLLPTHHTFDTAVDSPINMSTSVKLRSTDNDKAWFEALNNNSEDLHGQIDDMTVQLKSAHRRRNLDSIQKNTNLSFRRVENTLASLNARQSNISNQDPVEEMTLTFHEWASLMEAGNVLKKHGHEQSFRLYLAQSGIGQEGTGGVKDTEMKLFGCLIEDGIHSPREEQPKRAGTFPSAAPLSQVTKSTHFSEPVSSRRVEHSFSNSDSANTTSSPPSDTFSLKRADTSGTAFSSTMADIQEKPEDLNASNAAKTSLSTTSTITTTRKSVNKEKKLNKKSTKYGLNALFGTVDRPILTANESGRVEAKRKQKEREEAYSEGPRWMKVLGGLV